MKRQTQILRDTAIQSKPHTLVRPQRHYEYPPQSKNILSQSVSGAIRADEGIAVTNATMSGSENAVKLGIDRYQEGFLAGQVEANAKLEREFAAALQAKFDKELNSQVEARLSQQLQFAVQQKFDSELEHEVEKRIAARLPRMLQDEYSERLQTEVDKEVSLQLQKLFDVELQKRLDLELNQLRLQVHQEAYDDGLRKSRVEIEQKFEIEKRSFQEDSLQRLQEKIHSLESMAMKLPKEVGQQLGGVEDAMVELCFAAICKFVGENAVDIKGIAAIVNHQIKEFVSAPVELHVHPQDWAFIEETRKLKALAPAASELLLNARVTWVPDNRVELGGVIIRSRDASLDARLETMLVALKNALVRTRDEKARFVQQVNPIASSSDVVFGGSA